MGNGGIQNPSLGSWPALSYDNSFSPFEPTSSLQAEFRPVLEKILPAGIKDSSFGRLNRSLLKETDDELFLEAVFHFASHLENKDQLEVAGGIYQLLTEVDAQKFPFAVNTQRLAEARLQAISGSGQAGARLEFLGKRVVKDTLQPVPLLGMTGAMALGKLTYVGLFARLGRSGGFLAVGGRIGAKGLAGLGSMLVEAPALPAIVRGMNSLLGRHAPGDLAHESWDNGLFLAAMRFSHLGGTALSQLKVVQQSALTQRLLPTATTFGGVVLAHKFQQYFDPSKQVSDGILLADSLVDLTRFSLADGVSRRFLGRTYQRFLQDIDRHSRRVEAELGGEKISAWGVFAPAPLTPEGLRIPIAMMTKDSGNGGSKKPVPSLPPRPSNPEITYRHTPEQPQIKTTLKEPQLLRLEQTATNISADYSRVQALLRTAALAGTAGQPARATELLNLARGFISRMGPREMSRGLALAGLGLGWAQENNRQMADQAFAQSLHLARTWRERFLKSKNGDDALEEIYQSSDTPSDPPAPSSSPDPQGPKGPPPLHRKMGLEWKQNARSLGNDSPIGAHAAPASGVGRAPLQWQPDLSIFQHGEWMPWLFEKPSRSRPAELLLHEDGSASSPNPTDGIKLILQSPRDRPSSKPPESGSAIGKSAVAWGAKFNRDDADVAWTKRLAQNIRQAMWNSLVFHSTSEVATAIAHGEPVVVRLRVDRNPENVNLENYKIDLFLGNPVQLKRYADFYQVLWTLDPATGELTHIPNLAHDLKQLEMQREGKNVARTWLNFYRGITQFASEGLQAKNLIEALPPDSRELASMNQTIIRSNPPPAPITGSHEAKTQRSIEPIPNYDRQAWAAYLQKPETFQGVLRNIYHQLGPEVPRETREKFEDFTSQFLKALVEMVRKEDPQKVISSNYFHVWVVPKGNGFKVQEIYTSFDAVQKGSEATQTRNSHWGRILKALRLAPPEPVVLWLQTLQDGTGAMSLRQVYEGKEPTTGDLLLQGNLGIKGALSLTLPNLTIPSIHHEPRFFKPFE